MTLLFILTAWLLLTVPLGVFVGRMLNLNDRRYLELTHEWSALHESAKGSERARPRRRPGSPAAGPSARREVSGGVRVAPTAPGETWSQGGSRAGVVTQTTALR